MSKYEAIYYPDGSVILIGRVRRSNLGSLEALLRILQERWMDFEQDTEKLVAHAPSWDIVKAIADLFPRGDKPGLMGFDLEGLRAEKQTIERLFLYQVDEEGYRASRLVEMHNFDPVPRKENDDDYEPIDSSGNAEIDLLASLAVGFTVTDALLLFETLDAESLDQFLYYSNELKRDPEERKNEALAEDFASWKEENTDLFREGLGIKFAIPKKDDQ